MSKPGVSLSDDSNEVICSRIIDDRLNRVLHVWLWHCGLTHRLVSIKKEKQQGRCHTK